MFQERSCAKIWKACYYEFIRLPDEGLLQTSIVSAKMFLFQFRKPEGFQNLSILRCPHHLLAHIDDNYRLRDKAERDAS